MDATEVEAHLHELVASLTVGEKVDLLTGKDHWSTRANERIGLRSMVMSDGPTGVRGELWDERSPSLNLPSASSLSSSWDLDIARRFAACVAGEARRKGIDIVLGPTINLHRSPLAGRHFEAFSEDPLLTGELATAYVRTLQAHGIAATPKHYVANDSETDRFVINVVIGERALHEVYLLPFEKAVEDGGAWLVMSAYNSVNGVTLTENTLLEDPLRSAWGFDGVVVSDWGAVRSLDSAAAAQDLVMPGPGGPWGAALVSAVHDGRVPEDVVDQKVRRLLRVAGRVGALAGSTPSGGPPVPSSDDGRAFAREAAREGTVLLRNAGELPWSAAGLTRIAVVGQHATQPRTQGGGSATVVPASIVTPLEGIRRAFADASVRYELGAVVEDGIVAFPLDSMTNPVSGRPGAHVRMLDVAGEELLSEERRASTLVYFSGRVPLARVGRIEFRTRFVPSESGQVRIGFAAGARGRVVADGTLLGEETSPDVGREMGAAFLTPPTISFPVQVTAGVGVEVLIELEPDTGATFTRSALSITFGVELDASDPDLLIQQAVDAAAEADVAVVVIGSSTHGESEGYDREDLSLPGRQDQLVRAVASANPRTVVVVNAGAPVLMPWREEVSAILVTYFAGEECGSALADVLSGAGEPGGRLPTTWPREQGDVPVIDTQGLAGDLAYAEGIHLGYRAWLKAGTRPAYPFGHGLGYTTWDLVSAEAVRSADAARGSTVVTVDLRNTGVRPGKHVVQVYAERKDSSVDRPVRWLVGWAVVRAAAGASATAEIVVDDRSLAHWDGGWHVEPGAYTLRIGHDVDDLPLAVTVDLQV